MHEHHDGGQEFGGEVAGNQWGQEQGCQEQGGQEQGCQEQGGQVETAPVVVVTAPQPVEEEPLMLGAQIRVIGVGGGGGNAVNSMIRSDSIRGVTFSVANTDAQALKSSLAPSKTQIGGMATRGLGAGANPNVGREAANEDRSRLAEQLRGADMVFIAAGMGGGTGTGAAPVVANIARDAGALTVGIVTKPFTREGKQRLLRAEQGIKELKKHVDSLIVIPNDKLLGLAGKTMGIADAFRPADEVLLQAVKGISDLITTTGLINVDFADVKTIMCERGMAMMGIGIGTGENRAVEAAKRAISSPLLEDVDITGARGVLVNISGPSSMTMDEFDSASEVIHNKVHEDANIIVGLVLDDSLGDTIKVTAIATGFGDRFDLGEIDTSQPAQAGRDEYHHTVGAGVHDIPAARPGRPTQVRTIVQAHSFGTEEEDQYDVPTFMRKGV